jgi:hypothetical protein
MNPTKNFPRVRQWFRGEFQSFYSIEGTLVLSDYELVFYATDSSRARDMHVRCLWLRHQQATNVNVLIITVASVVLGDLCQCRFDRSKR